MMYSQKTNLIYLLAVFLLMTTARLCAGSDLSDYTKEERDDNLKRFALFKSYAAAVQDEVGPISGHSESRRLEKNMRLYEKKLSQMAARSGGVGAPLAYPGKKTDDFIVERDGLNKIRDFLEANISATLMPLSFRASKDYWQSLNEPPASVEAVLERALVANSLNIYDGALWQIALSLMPSKRSHKLVDLHTQRLTESEAGDIRDLRGYGPAFRYGDAEALMDRQNGFFFRMISDSYLQDDPLGYNEVAGFPNFSRVHHEDWKPITGEQAWAAMIGPLQIAYRNNGGNVAADSQELALALSILPALGAMQSPIGAFYHAPAGTFGIHPKLISNENNLSAYAALRMLEQILKNDGGPNAQTVRLMLEKLEHYFQNYAYDRQSRQFYSGGFYVEEKFIPSRLMAVDCQTWAIAALGPKWIDDRFGKGESFEILKKTIELSGRKNEDGVLEGVGFTSDHTVVSVEWTCGAILAARMLADFYKASHPDWSVLLLAKAAQMRTGIEKYKVDIPENKTAYLYVSRRYFIPFGWWANPVPSLSSSAWVIFTDLFYNPFVLGGGNLKNLLSI